MSQNNPWQPCYPPAAQPPYPHPPPPPPSHHQQQYQQQPPAYHQAPPHYSPHQPPARQQSWNPPLPPTPSSYAPQNIVPSYPAGAAPQVYARPTFPHAASLPPSYIQPPNAPPAVHGVMASAVAGSGFTASGRKRALLVGINYSGRQRLRGCCNDVRCMQYLLATRFGFRPEDTVVMTDKPCGIAGVEAKLPTRRNMLDGMRKLVRGAQAGDSLFFHFSGHGGQMVDRSGDEDDGYDETLVPMDWEGAGHIVDDEIYDILVRRLPGGVRLTAVLDACHSGTALDLPYQHDVRYTGSGMTVGSGKPTGGGMASAMRVAGAVLQGRPSAAVVPLLDMVSGGRRKKKVAKVVAAPDWTKGEVLMFAGCTDKQTSADTNKLGNGKTVTGAMTYALIEAIEHSTVGDWHNYSYQKLLHTMRQKLLAARMSQTPQFSSSHPFDMNNRFLV